MRGAGTMRSCFVRLRSTGTSVALASALLASACSSAPIAPAVVVDAGADATHWEGDGGTVTEIRSPMADADLDAP